MGMHSNIVGSASLYGHALNTKWTVLPYMDIHSTVGEGVFNFLVELTWSQNFKKN